MKLGESHYKHWRKNRARVALLPWGATEAHNLHLPYAMDTLMAEKIGALAVEKANKAGAKAVLLPAIPYGTQTNTMAFNLNMNLNPSTQLLILKDLCASLKTHKVPHLVLLNGHGGNDFYGIQRELYGCGVLLVVVNLWQLTLKVAGELFEKGGGHADEYESSTALHLFPELVLPLSQADSGKAREPKIKAFREGWAKISRPWEKLTHVSGLGDPRLATAEKGRKATERTVAKLSEFLRELSTAKVDGKFPY